MMSTTPSQPWGDSYFIRSIWSQRCPGRGTIKALEGNNQDLWPMVHTCNTGKCVPRERAQLPASSRKIRSYNKSAIDRVPFCPQTCPTSREHSQLSRVAQQRSWNSSEDLCPSRQKKAETQNTPKKQMLGSTGQARQLNRTPHTVPICWDTS